jgi:hypothetical protein
MSQAIFADITHHLHAAIGKRPEIADQIRPPIAATYHTDFYWFCHIINSIWFLSLSQHLRHPRLVNGGDFTIAYPYAKDFFRLHAQTASAKRFEESFLLTA